MKIVDAQINWHEGFVNPPSVRILVDEELIPYGDRVWRKLPAKRSTLSAGESERDAGRTARRFDDGAAGWQRA